MKQCLTDRQQEFVLMSGELAGRAAAHDRDNAFLSALLSTVVR